MRVNRFHRLTVKRPAAFCSTGRQAYRDWHRYPCSPVMRAGVVENLIKRNTGKIGKLHFDNRPHPLNSSADRSADDRVFANRRIQYTSREFLPQTFRRFERATERPAKVLPVNENPFVLTQQFCLRLADRFEICDAHEGNAEI